MANFLRNMAKLLVVISMVVAISAVVFYFDQISTVVQDEKKVYIVYLGGVPEGVHIPIENHYNILRQVLDTGSPEEALIYSFGKNINGFSAKLTEKEKHKLVEMKCAVSIFPNREYELELHTTRSWDFIGFQQDVPRFSALESDTIVGILDGGVWPESESFNDDGFFPPHTKWKGECNGGQNFTCNNKLIGARAYNSDTARDEDGHGTHTASTAAAGNKVENVSFFGLAQGNARGGMPSARIAAYKVCSRSGCGSQEIINAFDDAISDGVDIISISIGFSEARDYVDDPIAIGAFHAIQKGVLTVQSAGNHGPAQETVGSIAPWILTVGATTMDMTLMRKVILGDKMPLVGNAVNPFGDDLGIVQDYLNSESAPVVASFSSRGPSPIRKDILKPDIVAPGVDIVAAWSPETSPTHVGEDKMSVKYNIISGTSMACPRVSGAAAYVKSANPDWSPSAIKSTLMTTAYPMTSVINPGGAFDYGAGFIDPMIVVAPGLVYDANTTDYANFLCSIYELEMIRKITGQTNTTCPEVPTSFQDLNYPTMVCFDNTCTFKRTVTNVGVENSTYEATIVAPDTLKITVDPNVLTFESLYEKKSFVVTVTATSEDFSASAWLSWFDGVHFVQSPIAVHV